MTVLEDAASEISEWLWWGVLVACLICAAILLLHYDLAAIEWRLAVVGRELRRLRPQDSGDLPTGAAPETPPETPSASAVQRVETEAALSALNGAKPATQKGAAKASE